MNTALIGPIMCTIALGMAIYSKKDWAIATVSIIWIVTIAIAVFDISLRY